MPAAAIAWGAASGGGGGGGSTHLRRVLRGPQEAGTRLLSPVVFPPALAGDLLDAVYHMSDLMFV